MSKPKVIGLLGGTFNPAHTGHVHISEYAMTTLPIDAIWWLVSYNHPVKGQEANFAERFKSAQAVAATYPFITVSDFEQHAGTRYTIDTILALKKAYPDYRFIWMMGADNLTLFHQWHRWNEILNHVSIVVMNRGSEKESALQSPFAQKFAVSQVFSSHQLALEAPFTWYFANSPLHDAASSNLRR